MPRIFAKGGGAVRPGKGSGISMTAIATPSWGKWLARGEEVASEIEETIAREAVAEAKRRCPVDTGRLQNSIRAENTSEGWAVGTNVFYSLFVEFGTIHMSAQPYLRPGVRAARMKVKNSLRRGILTGGGL